VLSWAIWASQQQEGVFQPAPHVLVLETATRVSLAGQGGQEPGAGGPPAPGWCCEGLGETAAGAARAAAGDGTVLTEIELLAGSFQAHPLGRGLDEEVPDEVTALLACKRDGTQRQHPHGCIVPPLPAPAPVAGHPWSCCPCRGGLGTHRPRRQRRTPPASRGFSARLSLTGFSETPEANPTI